MLQPSKKINQKAEEMGCGQEGHRNTGCQLCPSLEQNQSRLEQEGKGLKGKVSKKKQNVNGRLFYVFEHLEKLIDAKRIL